MEGRMTSGEYGDFIVDFGKHGGKCVCNVSNSYMVWCLEQDWFEDKYKEWAEAFENELKWRDAMGVKIED